MTFETLVDRGRRLAEDDRIAPGAVGEADAPWVALHVYRQMLELTGLLMAGAEYLARLSGVDAGQLEQLEALLDEEAERQAAA